VFRQEQSIYFSLYLIALTSFLPIYSYQSTYNICTESIWTESKKQTLIIKSFYLVKKYFKPLNNIWSWQLSIQKPSIVTDALSAAIAGTNGKTLFWKQRISTLRHHGPIKMAARRVGSKHPSATQGLTKLTLSEVVDSYATVIKIQEKTIVIGHLLGGLMTQIIVNRDLAAAGLPFIVPHWEWFLTSFFLKGGWKSMGFSPHWKNLFDVL